MSLRINGMPLKVNYRPYNSGGKGGQHANKTLNAIEATVRLPDGRTIKANASTSKCQHTNKRKALGVLVARVREALQPERTRPDLSERVRTYHKCDDRVTDHASGEKRSYRDVTAVHGRGVAFDELVDARRKALEMRKACE